MRGLAGRYHWKVTRVLLVVVVAALSVGYRCGGRRVTAPDLEVTNANRLPARLDQGPGARLYVTDPQVGSLFFYAPDLSLESELKGLDRPLGVAVDGYGQIYVGSDGGDCVEAYSTRGVRLRSFGQGLIQMPNDLAFDRNERLYVADSRSNVVWVFDRKGAWLGSIGSPGDGNGELAFPVAVAVGYRGNFGELYVGDQRNARVQVFDLDGNFLRTLGARMEANSGDWEGKFVRIQSLAVDGQERVHVVDSMQHMVQILDPDTGAFLDAYGTFGTGPGELNVPLDIAISPSGQVWVANSGNQRVEMIHEVQEP